MYSVECTLLHYTTRHVYVDTLYNVHCFIILHDTCMLILCTVYTASLYYTTRVCWYYVHCTLLLYTTRHMYVDTMYSVHCFIYYATHVCWYYVQCRVYTASLYYTTRVCGYHVQCTLLHFTTRHVYVDNMYIVYCFIILQDTCMLIICTVYTASLYYTTHVCWFYVQCTLLHILRVTCMLIPCTM